MKNLSFIDTSKIAKVNPIRQKLLCFLAILEGYLSLISKEHLQMINKDSIDEVTLKDLGTLYHNTFKQNDGKNGVCWEFTIYQTIKHNDDTVNHLINESINLLSKQNSFEELDCILWGGEKDLPLDSIKEVISEDDFIYTPNFLYPFKDYIDDIYYSFRKKNIRSQLPKSINNIWKTDLFVKKKSDNIWYSITVKWNKNDIKYYPGLAIGVYFKPFNKKKLDVNPRLLKKSFVSCEMPFEYNIGSTYASMFRVFSNILNRINYKLKNIYFIDFPSKEEYQLFLLLHKNSHRSCCELMYETFESLSSYYDSRKKSSELILSKSLEDTFVDNDNNNSNGIIVLPCLKF